MPKGKPFSLSGMVDTDAEEDTLNADAFPTPESNQENAGAAKKKAPRQKASAKRFSKPKRLSGGSITSNVTTAPKSRAGRKRAPLKEQANNHNIEDTEEVDEFAAPTDGEASTELVAKPKPAAKRKAQENKGDRPAKARATGRVGAVKDGEFEYTPTTVRQIRLDKDPVAVKGNGTRRQASVELRQEKTIPETQVSMDINTSVGQEDLECDDGIAPQSVFRRSDNARATSRQRQIPVARPRAGSVSDADRAVGDVTLRRRLGDMTRKFETIDLRYRNLKDTRMTEAEANYERLKKQSDINAKAANDLISSLKKEIATQKAIAHESQSFQNQITSRDADIAKTQALANQLSTSLAEAQNENKVLQAKLANSRSASVAVEPVGSRTPGSTMKRNQAQARTIMVGSAEAAHAAQVAHLKEDLYSDLTGLILRGVDIGSEADTYDCIQTGRNGTLHFKLAVAKESDESYENTEFQYTPRLDNNRDRNLIALLPEYLTDEITFSRTNATMFYGRVVETLTKRRPVGGDE